MCYTGRCGLKLHVDFGLNFLSSSLDLLLKEATSFGLANFFNTKYPDLVDLNCEFLCFYLVYEIAWHWWIICPL